VLSATSQIPGPLVLSRGESGARCGRGGRLRAAISFFVDALGFELAEDTPLPDAGRPKRWVVVRPPGAQTGILLAQADGPAQAAVVGHQLGGRVGFFLRVDDFEAQYQRMRAAGVEFVGEPRDEAYGRVVVFIDVAGNKWDLLGPAS
jgi:catechol 2,3-dioxygenase-like lactoylglutathione lyase family enzyme